MIEDLTQYDWEARTRVQIPGTEDWVVVAFLGEGGYDWQEFKAFYSPSARRYFWHGDSGCSCNSWNDALDSADSFENGYLDDLFRAWEAFTKEYGGAFSPNAYLDGVSKIMDLHVRDTLGRPYMRLNSNKE